MPLLLEFKYIHFDLNLTNLTYFYPLEVVDRVSEKQLKVDKKNY